MLDYGQFIDLDNVTLEDCETLYDKKDMITVIEDGHIRNFVTEEKE